MAERAPWMEGAERRRQIIEAGLQVFAAQSYAVATTAEVARTAGIAQATVFKYFPTKRDLFVAVLGRTTDLVIERWENAFAEGKTPLDGLLGIARTYSRMAAEQQVTFRVRIRAVAESQDPVIADAARTSYQTIAEFLKGKVEAAKASGQLPASLDATAAAWYILAVGQGFNLNNFVDFEWNKQILPELIRYLFQGLGAPVES